MLAIGVLSTDQKILFHQDEVKDCETYKRAIAYIPDTPYLYDLLTGEENLEFINHLWGVRDKKRYDDKLTELLVRFQMQDSLKQLVKNYSLGMKHKLFFIAMLARETDLMLLDEPMSALDQESQALFIHMLKEYSNAGKAVVFVTHLEDLQNQLANKTYQLERGMFHCAVYTPQKA